VKRIALMLLVLAVVLGFASTALAENGSKLPWASVGTMENGSKLPW
jgi:hypothetical protein